MRKNELELVAAEAERKVALLQDTVARLKHELDAEKAAYNALAAEKPKSGSVTTSSVAAWVVRRLKDARNDLERAGLVAVRSAVGYLADCERRGDR